MILIPKLDLVPIRTVKEVVNQAIQILEEALPAISPLLEKR